VKRLVVEALFVVFGPGQTWAFLLAFWLSSLTNGSTFTARSLRRPVSSFEVFLDIGNYV